MSWVSTTNPLNHRTHCGPASPTCSPSPWPSSRLDRKPYWHTLSTIQRKGWSINTAGKLIRFVCITFAPPMWIQRNWINKMGPVLEEAQRLADEGHLHFDRSATLQGVFGWPQQHVCHLLHHHPHVWHILRGKRENTDINALLKDNQYSPRRSEGGGVSPCHQEFLPLLRTDLRDLAECAHWQSSRCKCKSANSEKEKILKCLLDSQKKKKKRFHSWNKTDHRVKWITTKNRKKRIRMFKMLEKSLKKT